VADAHDGARHLHVQPSGDLVQGGVEAVRLAARRASASPDVENGAEICISLCQRSSADVANTPMPKMPAIDRAARPQPAPVGLFLAPTHRHRRSSFGRPGMPDWHGMSPRNVAFLIRHYTRFGDVVLDLDEHPTVIAATRYLRRTPARLVTQGRSSRVRLMPPRPRNGRQRRSGPGADLVMVTLPLAGECRLDLHGMTRVMTGWRCLLRPGGHLIVALTARRPKPGTIGHRSTLIVAARAAGLLYHQHVPVVLAPLPERDPRTDAESADDGRRLFEGRHLPAFRELVVFAGSATGEETTRA
jgi:hypothetical protein